MVGIWIVFGLVIGFTNKSNYRAQMQMAFLVRRDELNRKTPANLRGALVETKWRSINCTERW